jgi:Holliday junction resolvase RusA-like endonuclease
VNEIIIHVPGVPVAKGRPTVGHSFGGFITLRTPQKTVIYENLIKQKAAEAMKNNPPILGPVQIKIEAFFPPLKTFSKKKRSSALNGKILPTKKPDIDNIAKSALDGMNKVVYLDDTQVIDITLCKRYAETPGLIIHVKELIMENI